MIIFPAIDLKAGKCVRLLKGDMKQATIFNDDPLQQAQEFCNLGFKFIHIVDLNFFILYLFPDKIKIKNKNVPKNGTRFNRKFI